MSTLVLGIGNTLLTDEGIGVHVVHHLQGGSRPLQGLVAMDGGTLSFTLAEALGTHEGLILVDAARLGSPPGTMRCFAGEAMDAYLSRGIRSVHELGLSDLMDMARLNGDLPSRRALLAIEPASLDWGTQPSPALAPIVPVAAEFILALVECWRAAEALSPRKITDPGVGD